RIEFEVINEDHTLCNALRDELWNNENIEISAYNIKHPLISNPVMLVETTRGDPRKALQEAVENLKKKVKEIKDSFNKAL
ncbi:MAG: RpoL/Rpb11 RNA polymerase subunit family protein, partial [Nanoarchaeota archaeon]